ncbi:MAG: phage virion morphogenesis protein [Prevotella sp.]|nr:phage virion morphogenesis protein [Prevotella sp.]
MNENIQKIIKNILRDIQVEMKDEFDQNFERQAFFSEAWQRRKSPTRPGGHILVDTGQLRRSIKSRTTENSIIFYTDLPYAEIHNDGGEIVVTTKMKKFFWHKYYEATGSFGRKKDGSRRNDKRTIQLSDEAQFWKFLALKKAGTTIKIPRRRFLGTSPEVEKAVRDIIEENITDYIEQAIDSQINRK